MSAGWETKTLGELCTIRPPKKEARAKLGDDTEVGFLPMEDLGIRQQSVTASQTRTLGEVYGGYTYFADGDVLLAKITPCFQNGKLGIARDLPNGVGFGSSEYFVLRSKGELLPEYLFYFLSQDSFTDGGVRQMSGAVGHQRVPPEYVAAQEIPLPPLAEQKRIVAILNEAFTAIEQAEDATRSTIAPLTPLVERERDALLLGCEGGGNTRLGDHIDLLAGPAFKSAGYTDDPSGIRLLRGDNIVPSATRWEGLKRWPADDTDAFDRYWLHADDVVIAMDRPWISTGFKRAMLTDEDIPSLLVQRVARLRCRDTLSPRFLYHLISSTSFIEQMIGGQTGTGVPHISGKQIEAFLFTCPNLDEQRSIAMRLDGMIESVHDAVELRHRKLGTLHSLRASLLRTAFLGGLSASAHNSQAGLTESIAVTRRLGDKFISAGHSAVSPIALGTTELHAGVLALAYRAHQKVESVNTFGHVKAEKIAHMAEALGVVDLHRQPTKQAAGPADLARFQTMREYAETNSCFHFVERTGGKKGYQFVPLSKFDTLIERASSCLDQAALRPIFNLFAPVKRDEAEVLATVYAAWNNFLLDGVQPSEEQIVHAARDEWHPDKLKYPRSDFIKAIRKLRRSGLTPNGTAKRVNDRPQLGLWDSPVNRETLG